ncbi:terminase small subunit [Ancylobacter defluvii]|uniref:terminase small subunit n=1 Tax=Ancylobacter defluvii TaxID=1282440 RepID=UPI001BCBEB10|nr:terminase small subunit [Ancylobacter defluvii]MBS7589733.1 terminase small subunit [Ancylobacter defluvii]
MARIGDNRTELARVDREHLDPFERALDRLTPREQNFVHHYLLDLSASEAARRAGYAEHTARFMASRILRNPDVAAAIRIAMAERARRTQIDGDAVLAVGGRRRLPTPTTSSNTSVVPAAIATARTMPIGGGIAGSSALPTPVPKPTTSPMISCPARKGASATMLCRNLIPTALAAMASARAWSSSTTPIHLSLHRSTMV